MQIKKKYMKITVLERDAMPCDRLLEVHVTSIDPEYGGTTFLRNADKIL
jgi:hypothetical protein